MQEADLDIEQYYDWYYSEGWINDIKEEQIQEIYARWTHHIDGEMNGFETRKIIN